ncbi:MAG: rhomboid family intramembrane serine protease [Bacteroidota bacterium]
MLSKRNLRNVIRWPLTLLAIIWAVSLANLYLFGNNLNFYYALYTREIAGLFGIITAPLLHSGWPHLLSNSLPFLSLTGLMVFFYPRLWPRVMTTLWLGTGALVWLLGRPGTAHIGASGVVYALAAFLAFSGIFRRDFRAVVVSLVVLFYYGGMVVGILPGQEGISWESHLLGLVMGALSGWLFRGQLEEHEIATKRKEAERRKKAPKEHFLQADQFTKTKDERAQEAFWARLEKLKEEDKLSR